ncbi:hypothetical protein NLM33_32185 [Bradyrhizobium sp. CCGUVB1N3]|uniref:hypothetical protein n=1 Tax=Bradyrhizobium sp. CCGUVB1N3 TaxID=2949629 RepID=UPI0020B455B2|nr:hypothetical protein [Bradyrhizobium sp. CCGUVB1N3]MCP3474982.1 hypothetical protein [Bradyrhizobium sp. CCGUVB1N3]
MGLLFIGVLAGILIGFGFFAPSQGYFLGCGPQPCFDRVAMAHPAAVKPAALGPDPLIARASPAAAARSDKTPLEKKRGNNNVARAAPPVTWNRVSPSNSAEGASDSVLNKAKVSIAAKMEDPDSAEFSDMKRAVRKNTLGRSVDTICGRVKGKNASGEETGERPFLYLVKENDAYVVDGPANSAAAIAYRNICN